jgi:hypothetical protein
LSVQVRVIAVLPTTFGTGVIETWPTELEFDTAISLDGTSSSFELSTFQWSAWPSLKPSSDNGMTSEGCPSGMAGMEMGAMIGSGRFFS